MKLKRFNLIMLLALLVTIGGVYAAWVYPVEGSLSDAETYKSLELVAPEINGEIGTLKIDETAHLDLKIDGAEVDGVANTAVLLIRGSFKVIFTPNPNANPADLNGGTGVKLDLVLTENYGGFECEEQGYNVADIILVTVDPIPLNNGDAFTGEIIVYGSQEDALAAGADPNDCIILEEHIRLSEIVLANKHLWDEFNEHIEASKHVKIEIKLHTE